MSRYKDIDILVDRLTEEEVAAGDFVETRSLYEEEELLADE